MLTQNQLDSALILRDLSDPAQGVHAMQLLVEQTVAALTQTWAIQPVIERGQRIISITDNYDNLGYPADGAARDSRYTRYVDNNRILRTQTSAIISGALKKITLDNLLLVCPGIIYRRDVIDRLHVGEPHQLDLWRLSKKPMTDDDLLEMISVVVETVIPGAQWRANDAVHPYTVGGKEVEILHNREWVELLECGLIHPDVLIKAELSKGYGLALGMDLDRALMLRKNISDIRLLRSEDERVARQMLDLAPYQPVSCQPAARRDLSILVEHDSADEEIGDRVRDALSSAVEWIEEISVISRTPVEDLPPAAWQRMGASPGQINVLLKVVLRHPTRSLSKSEANSLRDRIYGCLHQGTAHEWS